MLERLEDSSSRRLYLIENIIKSGWDFGFI